MNYPLDNSTALDNVTALRRALEDCDGHTSSIRQALSACLIDYQHGFRTAEASLAIATATIVCTPQPMERGRAKTYRQGSTSLAGYTPELAIQYDQIGVDALTRITSRSTASLAERLRTYYDVALAAEAERLKSVSTRSALVTAA